jgi:hypothetical protein
MKKKIHVSFEESSNYKSAQITHKTFIILSLVCNFNFGIKESEFSKNVIIFNGLSCLTLYCATCIKSCYSFS